MVYNKVPLVSALTANEQHMLLYSFIFINDSKK